MKRISIYFFLLVAFICVESTTIQAFVWGATDEKQEYTLDCDECACSCNALFCGGIDLQFQAGIVPIIWKKRGEIDIVNCAFAPASPILTLFDMPNFHTFFKIPWTVGGQIGYAWTDNTRLYIELNYIQAHAKSNVALATMNSSFPTENYSFNLAKYRLFDFYIGSRYYWDRWYDRFSFFVGAKVGVVQHRNLNFNVSVTPPFPAIAILPSNPATSLFNRNTSVSGGLNFGFDICFWNTWSLVLTSDIVASCGPRAVQNIPITPPSGFTFTNLLVNAIQTELRFPITAAIRYSF